MRTIFLAMMMMGLIGCTAEEEPNLLLGKWQMYYVNIGGQISAGPQFHGTTYDFNENGTVFAQSQGGDSITVKYELHGDTLIYISKDGNEIYNLDSLQENLLQISINVNGTHSFYKMQRVQVPGDN